MARYEDLPDSGFAWQIVDVPIANLPHGIQKGTPEQAAQAAADGLPPKLPQCGIRALSPGEDIEAHRLAAAFSKTQGVDYNETHPVCVNSLMVYTLAMACVDPDSDRRKPVLFFGDSPELAAQTLRDDPKHLITLDTVVYLHERYLIWKDKINPQANTIADYEMQSILEKSADDLDFLASLTPGLRLKLLHTTGVLLVTSPGWTELASSFARNDATKSCEKPTRPGKPNKKAAPRAPKKAKRKARR